MQEVKVPAGAWVAVCDGAKALLLRNAGGGRRLNLTVHETLTQPNAADRELGTDKPGRAHQADRTSGSAVEETSWHEQAEAEFLKQVAGKLDDLVRVHAAKSIVLIAPPRALGMLRPALGAAASAAVTAEVPKDLVNLPVGDIERYLA